jgi:dTDP-4-amino-4,6-dideoxygalactose transaminase
MTWSVPLTTLEMPEEDVTAVLDCLEGGWLTMGPRTQAFEAALAERLGVQHAVAVSSGTAALHLTCLAVGLGPGDEMIVPGLTFVASASAARFCGAEPVLCEIAGPRDMNIDVEDVRGRIGERTKAVMAVHFCGYPAEVEALRALCDEHGLLLIEDCAQAITTVVDGRRLAGTVGHAGCLSFFSKKQLCVGEGGAVITDDQRIADKVRSLRSHAMTSVTWDRHRGHAESYDIVDIGFNYRLDEPRAALGLSRLARLDADIAARREVARAYREGLDGIPGLELVWTDEQVERSSHFAFPVLLPDMAERDEFRRRLKESGVQTTWYPPLSDFFTYSEAYPDLSLPRAEEAAFRHCALPMSAGLTDEDVETVIGAARAVRTAATRRS